jgi:hypothetical protein
MIKVIFYSILFLLVSLVSFSFGATFTSNSNGDWNAAIWTITDGTDGDGIPDSDDNVIIRHNITFNLNNSVSINSLKLDAWTCGLSITTTNPAYILTIINGIETTYSGGNSTFAVGTNTNISTSSFNIYAASFVTTGVGSTITASGLINFNAASINFDLDGDLSANAFTVSQGNLSVLNVSAASTFDIATTLTINSGPNTIDVWGVINTASIYLDGGTNSLNIYEDGEVNVSGGITLAGSAGLDVGNAGTLSVSGNVDLTGGSSLLVNGDMDVAGSMTLTNGVGAVEINGTLTVDNTLDIGNNNISGTGSISANPLICASGGNCSIQLGDELNILPIVLTYFNAYTNKTNVTLNWQTASEINNDYFTLERSKDGVTYEVIGTVLGAGTSMTAINYSFTDTKPLTGVSYYRLKQTDYDGKFEVFSPVSVSYLNESEIKIGSNPSAKELNISVNGEVGSGVAKICNVIGVLVKTIEISDNFTTVNVSDIPKGTYILVVSANKIQINKKILVQ